MSTHTPGPWTAQVSPHVACFAGSFSVEAGDFVICARAGVPNRAQESAANARLIAAAPDLLAVLKAIANSVECCTLCGCYPHEDNCSVLAAIAKAEGGSR